MKRAVRLQLIANRGTFGTLALCAVAAQAVAPAGHAQQALEAPPPAVVATTVEIEPVSTPETFSGTVEAIDRVEILARVQGFLESVEFGPGDRVDASDVLFRIESAPYDAAVAAAEARLGQTEAQLRNAEQELRRMETLTERAVAAEAQLEDAQAAQLSAEADVGVAEAQLEQARIEQGYTRSARRSRVRSAATSSRRARSSARPRARWRS